MNFWTTANVVACCVFAYEEVKKWEEVVQLAEDIVKDQNLDKKTLVVFTDIDETLVYPRDAVLNTEFASTNEYVKKLGEKECFEANIATFGKLMSRDYYGHRAMCVEGEDVANHANRMREDYGGLYAITARTAAEHLDGIISDLKVTEIKFSDLPASSTKWTKSSVATFDKLGTVFFSVTDDNTQERYSKGAMINEFLEKYAGRVNHIIFVDNMIKNIKSVESEVTKVDRTPVLYKGAEEEHDALVDEDMMNAQMCLYACVAKLCTDDFCKEGKK